MDLLGLFMVRRDQLLDQLLILEVRVLVGLNFLPELSGQHKVLSVITENLIPVLILDGIELYIHGE